MTPEPGAHSHSRRRVVQVAANLAALVALVGVSAAAMRLGRSEEHPPAQPAGLEARSLVASTSPDVAPLARQLADSTSGRHPLILSYHDVQPRTELVGDSRYPVAAEDFANQMAVLKAAGYHPLSVEQLITYFDGGPVPDRSVMITFDDNPHGLWSQADRILEREGLTGVVFVITSSVDTSSYYLDWNEIRAMHQSGRWEFQSHSDDLHERRPLLADGPDVAPLTNPLWLPEQNRPETLDEWRTRVHDDLERSIRSLARHRLPRPDLFAYPFSELRGDGGSRPTVPDDQVKGLLNAFFVASMVNTPDPTAVLADVQRSEVPRIEVLRTTTLDDFVTRLSVAQPAPSGAPKPLTQPALWAQRANAPGSVAFRDGTLALDPQPGEFAQVDLGKGLPEWANTTFNMTIDNLTPGSGTDPRHTVEASIRVHAGSGEEVVVEVEYGEVVVKHPDEPLARVDLGTARSVNVTASSVGDRTQVLVDGKVAATLRTVANPVGGLSLTMRRGTEATQDAPRVAKLTVEAPGEGP